MRGVACPTHHTGGRVAWGGGGLELLWLLGQIVKENVTVQCGVDAARIQREHGLTYRSVCVCVYEY